MRMMILIQTGNRETQRTSANTAGNSELSVINAAVMALEPTAILDARRATAKASFRRPRRRRTDDWLFHAMAGLRKGQ